MDKIPNPQRRTCSPYYGVPSCRGKSAGVVKRPPGAISHPIPYSAQLATLTSLRIASASRVRGHRAAVLLSGVESDHLNARRRGLASVLGRVRLVPHPVRHLLALGLQHVLRLLGASHGRVTLHLSKTQRALLASPSELSASPSELLASPSELLASPSELVASPSELLASPSELPRRHSASS
jgi:hypothetical protein